MRGLWYFGASFLDTPDFALVGPTRKRRVEEWVLAAPAARCQGGASVNGVWGRERGAGVSVTVTSGCSGVLYCLQAARRRNFWTGLARPCGPFRSHGYDSIYGLATRYGCGYGGLGPSMFFVSALVLYTLWCCLEDRLFIALLPWPTEYGNVYPFRYYGINNMQSANFETIESRIPFQSDYCGRSIRDLPLNSRA